MLYWLGAYSLIAAIIFAVAAVLIFMCYVWFECKARLHIPVHTKASHLAQPSIGLVRS